MNVLKKIRNLFILTFLLMLILFVLGFTSKLGIAYKILSILCLALLAAESYALFRFIHGLLIERNLAVSIARRSTLATIGSQLQHDLRNSLMIIDMALENATTPAAEQESVDLLQGAKTALEKIKVTADSLGEAAKIVQVRLETFDFLKSIEELAAALKEHIPAGESETFQLVLPIKSSKTLYAQGDSLKFLESTFQLCSAILKLNDSKNMKIAVTSDKKSVVLQVESSVLFSPLLLSALTGPLFHFGHGGVEFLRIWRSARTIEAMGGSIETSNENLNKKFSPAAASYLKITLPKYRGP